jgi:hypothetical protein
MENDLTFSLWRDFLKDGGLVVISPYKKYNWGVSTRDVIALFLAVRPILLRNPERDVDIRSWEDFSQSDREHNLLVIGSEVANQMAEFMRGEHALVIDFSFKIRKNCLIDTLQRERNCLVPVFEGEPSVHNTKVDYALITRTRNPFAPGKKIVILAGIKGYGTIAAALAFSEQRYWSEIDQRVDTVLGELQLREDEARNALIEIIIRADISERPRRGDPAIPSPRWPDEIFVELVRVNRNQRTEWVCERSFLSTWISRANVPSEETSLLPPEEPVLPPVSPKPEVESSKKPPGLGELIRGLLCSLAAMVITVVILVWAAKQVPGPFPIIAALAETVLIVTLGFVMVSIGVIDKETFTKLVGTITKSPDKQ